MEGKIESALQFKNKQVLMKKISFFLPKCFLELI